MLTYPTWLSPDILHLGPLRIRWYGMMYLIGFLLGRIICRKLCRSGFLRMSIDLVDDFLVALFIGMLLGARTFYMLVYFKPSPDEPFYWYTPFAVWQGGLSGHGAVPGMVLATLWFAWRHKIPQWNLTDALALAGSPGIIFGRIGNFINSELWGRVTTSSFGIRFPIRDFEGNVVDHSELRHPSQLYEAFGEGLIPFAVIWLLKPHVKRQGVLGAIWICTYAVARFIIEFTRQPDVQLGYYFGWMTMGQILCAIMLAAGIAIWIWCAKFAGGVSIRPDVPV